MPATKKALIIGASRGLGLGLVQRLKEDGWAVTATVRDTGKADALRAVADVRVEQLDMNDAQSVNALHQRLQGQVFDLLFVNAGIKGPDDQTPGAAPAHEVAQLFLTNSVAPISFAQRFTENLRPDTGVLAFMSSRLGSVTSQDAPELALYKASKAALNSLTNTYVSQLGERKLTVLSLHPGWVKTDIGGEDAPTDIATSTRGLLEVINAYRGKGGHYFLDYQGNTLSW